MFKIRLTDRVRVILLTFGVFMVQALGSQAGQRSELSESAIEGRLEMIKSGRADEVKAELPSLITAHQNDPGVLYLQGVLTSDGSEAVKIFQSVVDNFPKSDWADDALYRTYQYYYSIGSYKTAAQKYERLRQVYPNSPYLTHETPGNIDREADAVEKPRPTGGSEAGTFAVQVGAFSTAENATKQRRFFHSVGYPVEILNKVKRGKSYYLVWIGSFKSYDEARKFRNEMKGRYKIEPIVVER
jgi:tetratricopeptide (TPR) repeat protein